MPDQIQRELETEAWQTLRANGAPPNRAWALAIVIALPIGRLIDVVDRAVDVLRDIHHDMPRR